MTVIPSGYAQANFKFTGDGLNFPAEVTLGLDVQTATDPIADVAADLSGLFETLWSLSRFSADVTYVGLRLKYGPESTGPAVDVAASEPGGGDPSGSSQVSYLVRKATNDGGRAGRGRMYLPGVPENQVGPGGEIAGAAITSIDAALETFHTGLIGIDVLPVVLHGAGSPLTEPSFITAFTVDSTSATQRRRLRR